MKAPTIAATLLTVALFVPSVGWAHEGHTHKVMGTVSSISGSNLMVKTTDGKTVMVMLDAKTKITRGKEVLNVAALKVGDRVVAQGTEDKEMVMAKTLQVGAAAAKPAAAKTGATRADH